MAPCLVVLGAIAGAQNRMRRFRLNFVPSHWYAAVLLAALSFAAFVGGSSEASTGATVCGVVLAALFVVWMVPMVMRQVVFSGDGINRLRRPAPGGAAEALSGHGFPLTVRWTGRLNLDDHARRRFVGYRRPSGSRSRGTLLSTPTSTRRRGSWE